MKILILDPYPKRPYRISKDTSGGYGTANRFGDGLASRMITRLFSNEVDWPPLHCVYTAGVLKEQGHDVSYARDWPEGVTFDLCLVTSSIVCHETELDAIERAAAKGIPVGVIGPFATTMPEPYQERGAFVIKGEPEMFFRAHHLDAGILDTFQGAIPAAETVSLDDLPLPAWDIVFPAAPPKFGLFGGKETVLPIVASRGCPYSCMNYCTYPLQQGRTVRTRAPEKIVAEMAHWQDTLGVSYFIFRDPVFAINQKHAYALCDAIEASGRRFRFTVETHLRNMEPDLAQRLAAAGMDMVKVGIETVDPKVLDSAKRMSMEGDEQRQRITMLEDMGVKVTCHYILAMPGESPDTWKSTLKYARRLNTLFAQISVFTPYPGTPAFTEFEDKVLAKTYESFTQYDLVFRHENLTPEQVRTMLSAAYNVYYLRPSWVLKYLRMRFA